MAELNMKEFNMEEKIRQLQAWINKSSSITNSVSTAIPSRFNKYFAIFVTSVIPPFPPPRHGCFFIAPRGKGGSALRRARRHTQTVKFPDKSG